MDKLDIEKLVPVLVDLSKLSCAVKLDVVKKTVYDKLVAKVNNIDISGFALKLNTIQINQIQKNITSDKDKKFSDTSGLAKKTDDNAKITEIEIKIPSITGLATNSSLTAVENKIPDVRDLVKKKKRL